MSGVEFPGKPVVLINTSPRALHAQEQLREILTTMSAQLIEEASIALPLLGRNLSADNIAADLQLAGALRGALQSFVHHIKRHRTEAL